MTATPGEDPMTATEQANVLVAIAEVRGQLTSFIGMATALSEQQTSFGNRLGPLENRVTAIEAARRSTPTGWSVLNSVVPLVALILVMAQQFYGGK